MAYTEEEIRSILSGVISHLKGMKKPRWIKGLLEYDERLPEYYPHYNKRVDMMEAIKVHAVKSEFPWRIFKEKHPRCTPEEFKYLEMTWKQTTGPVFEDFYNTVTRIFHDSNYAIDYKDNGEGSLQWYLENDVPVWGSLEGYMMTIAPQLKLIDANGIIASEPYKIPTRVIVNEETGAEEIIYDDSIKFEPFPMYYSTKQIVAENIGGYYMVELEERSLVDEGAGVKKAMGYVYKFFDDEAIWKITQVGKFSDYTFSIDLYFQHGYGKVLCEKLKGRPEPCGDSVTYTSPFYMAVDLLDLCTMNHTILQAVMNRIGYPHTIQAGKPCQFEYTDSTGAKSNCVEGWVYEKETKIHCPNCQGTGQTDRLSPLGKLLFNTQTDLETGKSESDTKHKLLEFLEPGTANFQLIMQKIKEDENRARKILHLTSTDDNATTNQPTLATTEVLNAKAMNAFLKPISFDLFSLYEFSANAFGFIRDGANYLSPEFAYPVNYDTYTEKDYLIQIKTAREGDMPPFFIATILKRFLKSIHYNEATTARICELITATDRLWTFPKSVVDSMVSKATAEKWEAILYDSSIIFIGELEREDEKFWDKKFSEQQELLREKAKEKAGSIDSSAAAKVNTNASLRVQNIMGQSAINAAAAA